MYYECHITIEPVFGRHLELAKVVAKSQGFKVASLLMQKHRDHTPERSDHDTFMTGHDVDRQYLQARMVALIELLKKEQYKVWRYKIEHIVLDSRGDDILGLLS